MTSASKCSNIFLTNRALRASSLITLLFTVGPCHAVRSGLRVSRRASRTLGNATDVNGSQETIKEDFVNGISRFDVNDSSDANDSPVLEVAADQALRTALIAAGRHKSESMEEDSTSGLRGSSQQGGRDSQGTLTSVEVSSSLQSKNGSGVPQGGNDTQPHHIRNKEDESGESFESDVEAGAHRHAWQELLTQMTQMVNKLEAQPQGLPAKSKDPNHGDERPVLDMSDSDETQSSLTRFSEEDDDDEASDENEPPRPSHHSLKRYKEFPQPSDDEEDDEVETVILTRVPKRYRMHARGMARASERYLRMAEGIDDAGDHSEDDVVARHVGTIVHARTGDYKVIKLNSRERMRGQSSRKSKYAKDVSRLRNDVADILMNLERSQDAGEAEPDSREEDEEEQQEEGRLPQRRLRIAGRQHRTGLYSTRAEIEQAEEAEAEDEEEEDADHQTGGTREEEAPKEEEAEAQDADDEELQREREALAKEGFSFQQEEVESEAEANTLERASYEWIEAAIAESTRDSGLDEVLNTSTPEETPRASIETSSIEATHDEALRPISFVQEWSDPPAGSRKPAGSSEQPINFLQLSSRTERLSDRERRLHAAGEAATLAQASEREQKPEAGPRDSFAPQPLVSL